MDNSIQLRSRLFPAVAVSLLLHATFGLRLPVASSLAGDREAPPVMTVRMMRAPETAPSPSPTPVAVRNSLVEHPTTSEASESPSRKSERKLVPLLSGEASVRSRRRTDPALPAAVHPELRQNSAEPSSTVAPTASQLPPALDYLSGARLDPGPQPLGEIEPIFPIEAGLQQGSVVLRVLINEAGGVDAVTVVRAIPKGVFEASAVAAFSAARFSPGKLLGISVKSQITIEVNFTPSNRGGAVSGRAY